jgi:hypothetical protein
MCVRTSKMLIFKEYLTRFGNLSKSSAMGNVEIAEA